MFEEKPELYAFLARSGLTAFRADIEPLCVPAVCFDEAAGSPGGMTRLGGRPDLPDTLEWPRRAAYSHGRMLVEKLRNLDPGQAEACVTPMPLDFVAQVDLAEIARASALEGRLPDRGRLLFFWDALCGAYIESAQSCRVLWDASPPQALEEREPPEPPFAVDAIRPERGIFPRRSLLPRPIWSIPDRLLMKEIVKDEGLHIAIEDEYYEDVWEGLIDRGTTALESGREVLPHRLCGWPMPEQGDPRFEAAASARRVLRLFDRSPTPAETKECSAAMHECTLLFQLGLNDLWREYAEGTVYFVMREDDLKARNFERVHAIYQQT